MSFAVIGGQPLAAKAGHPPRAGPVCRYSRKAGRALLLLCLGAAGGCSSLHSLPSSWRLHAVQSNSFCTEKAFRQISTKTLQVLQSTLQRLQSPPGSCRSQVFILIGCIGGVLGALWIKLNVAMIRVRARHVPANRPMRRLCEVGLLLWAECCTAQSTQRQ